MTYQLPDHIGTPNKLATAWQRLAEQDTAQYFYNQVRQPSLVTTNGEESFQTIDEAKAEVRRRAFKHAHVDGFIAEYGVDQGKSYIEICKNFPDDEVFGFDAFAGLPNNGRWSGNIAHEGQFDYSGKIPFQKPTNGTIVNGWFNETCPGFDYEKPVAQFLHIDCDVYSSTVDIFNTLSGKVVPGTVIVFDDYCNYTGWRVGEWKAWQEFVQKQNLNYEYLDVGGMAVSLIVR